MAGEPGGPDLPRAIADVVRAGRLILPVLLPDFDLDWAEYRGPADLRPATRGLFEPSGPRLGTAAVAAASLVVVPAVAVDCAGVRLGRGGGSYDRALARVPAGVEIIALLYPGEYLSRLPAEQHDRRVTAALVAEPTGASFTARLRTSTSTSTGTGTGTGTGSNVR
jgi:5-formyltetrahydrofolate cyclo-ligase